MLRKTHHLPLLHSAEGPSCFSSEVMWTYFHRVTQLQMAPGCTTPIPGPRRPATSCLCQRCRRDWPSTWVLFPGCIAHSPGDTPPLATPAWLPPAPHGCGSPASHRGRLWRKRASLPEFFPFVHEQVGTYMAGAAWSHHEGSEPLLAGIGAAMQLLAWSQEAGAR